MFKKIFLGLAMVCTVIFSAIAIAGMTHFGAIYTTSGLGTKGNADVWFIANVKTTSTSGQYLVGGNNLVAGKNVRYCCTRLVRTDGTDTGIIYSKYAPSKTDSSIIHATASINRALFQTVTMTYDWYYF